MEMIEAAGRSIHPEVIDFRLAIETAATQHVGQALAIVRRHRFFDAVRAQAFDVAAHEYRCFIDGVAERVAGVAEYDQASCLRHEGAHGADRAFHQNIDALHRNAAARGGVAVDDQEPAATGGAGRLARIAHDVNQSGHHVFGYAGPGIAVNPDFGLLVHAAAIVADVTLDLDLDRGIDADADRVLALRILDLPERLVGVRREPVQCLVDLTHRGDVQIVCRHYGCSQA